MATTPVLPEGYELRPAAEVDRNMVVALLNACELKDTGETEETLHTLNDYWRLMSLDDDVRLVADSDGRLVAYGDLARRNPVRLSGYVCIRPAHRDRGLGSVLTEWVESRALERVSDAPDGARVRLQFGTSRTNTGAVALLEERGYTFERSFQRMVIDFDEPPPTAEWPEGVRFRAYRKGQDDRATWEAVEEAFADHWGNVRTPFEEWSKIYERSSFDASLWFLATDGEQIAGASLCSDRDDMGWVGSLSVRRPWRRRGVAGALLYHTFGEFYRRGKTRVGLGVDSTSLTGATRVYERVGMRADQHSVVYAKVLRDGVETSTQEIE